MKHIVVAVTNDLTYDQRMIRTCTSLSDEGYQVTLVGRCLEDSVDLIERPFQQVRLKCMVNTGPLFYAEFNGKLFSYLSDVSHELAVACDLDTILAVMKASRSKGRPFLYDSHELFTEVPELNGRGLIKGIWTIIAKMCIPAASAVYTVGSAIAAELSNRYGRSFAVVRNVPWLSHTAIKSWDDRDPVILYQGALNEGRGLEMLIDCMVDIHGYELVLAGEGDLSQALRNQVKMNGLEQRVRFLGRMNPLQLKEYTARARIGINVLESRSKSYYLSLANKFFDYMQAGTPSINMGFPEYRAIGEQYETGVILETLSVSGLSGAIKNLLTDRDLWSRLSQNCVEARQVFCWENEKEVLLELYREAIDASQNL